MLLSIFCIYVAVRLNTPFIITLIPYTVFAFKVIEFISNIHIIVIRDEDNEDDNK